MKDNLTILSGFLTVIILIILSPVLGFFEGWICGWLLKFFIGDTVANGLNLLFNTTRFTPESLPIVCGALATIGSFFKNTNTSSSKS